MKKSIIAAGAASIALAAMPVLGVFAIEDTITVSVSDYCKFQSTSADDTYIDNVAPGALKEWTITDDTSPMVVSCTKAYTLTPTMTALTAEGLDASTAIAYSASPATGGSQTWSASYDLSGDHTSSGSFTSGTAISGSAMTTTAGDTYKVAYKVGVSAAQPAGTYSGKATYVVAATN